MGAVQDLITLLDKIPIWKRVQALPDETDALKERVEELEKLFKNPVPKWCPACKSQLLNLVTGKIIEEDSKVYYRKWSCSGCGNNFKQYTNSKCDWISIDQN